jgi:predicted PurR-regulated permease PerM
MATLPAPDPSPAPLGAYPGGPLGRASLRIIAAAIVVGFCYWAASVVITLLLSVLLAFFLDPLVEFLERWHVPRVLGSLVAVLLLLALVGGVVVVTMGAMERFAADWPRYSAALRGAVEGIEQRLERLARGVAALSPREDSSVQITLFEESVPARSLLLRGLGSLYVFLFAVGFLPFLVFFMLAAKRALWHATLQLFRPADRTRAKHALENITGMMRSFVAGNFVVAAILSVASAVFFWSLGLDYPVMTGIASGVLNLVPYLGVVLAWIPPLIVGLEQLSTPGMFLLLAGMLSFYHLIALNVLMPALVGRKVHLNALAVTVALLFWGWLWGGMGLVLAIPITATIKVVCDHVDGWQPYGRWLGA